LCRCYLLVLYHFLIKIAWWVLCSTCILLQALLKFCDYDGKYDFY
jgi:hypothetical protein